MYPVPPLSRMWALNRPETGYLVLGTIGAIVSAQHKGVWSLGEGGCSGGGGPVVVRRE